MARDTAPLKRSIAAKSAGRAPQADIRVTQRYGAPAQRVFDAWLDPAMASAWLFATASRPLARVEIDARVGGSFRFLDRRRGVEIEHIGKYLEIARPNRLVFTLSMENGPKVVTRVIAEIVPLKTGCELTLTHEGVPPSEARRTEGHWTGMLYGLGVALGGAYRGPSHMIGRIAASGIQPPRSG